MCGSWFVPECWLSHTLLSVCSRAALCAWLTLRVTDQTFCCAENSPALEFDKSREWTISQTPHLSLFSCLFPLSTAFHPCQGLLTPNGHTRPFLLFWSLIRRVKWLVTSSSVSLSKWQDQYSHSNYHLLKSVSLEGPLNRKLGTFSGKTEGEGQLWFANEKCRGVSLHRNQLPECS